MSVILSAKARFKYRKALVEALIGHHHVVEDAVVRFGSAVYGSPGHTIIARMYKERVVFQVNERELLVLVEIPRNVAYAPKFKLSMPHACRPQELIEVAESLALKGKLFQKKLVKLKGE